MIRIRLLPLYVFLLMGLFFAACGPVDSPILEEFKGRVWSDENRNGFQDEGESGISGLTIRIDPQIPGYEPIEIKTERDGNYYISIEIEYPPETVWLVTIESKDGRFFTTQNAGSSVDDDKVDSDVNADGVAEYDKKKGLDAGLLPVGAVLGSDDVPTFEQYILSGFVYTDKGGDGFYNPGDGDVLLSEVTVELYSDLTQEVLNTTTTEEGFYKFEIEWRDGPVRVRVLKSDTSLEFSPAQAEGSVNFPSTVDMFGEASEVFDFTMEAGNVHAGLVDSSPVALEDPTQNESDDVFRVSCETGEDTEDNPFSGTIFDPSGDGEGTTFEIDTPEVPSGVTYCWGIDVAGEGKPTTGPNPNFALEEGNHYSVSACAVNGALAGINAAQTDLNGESIQISTAATASISSGVASLFVPVSDIPSGMTGVRLVVSDLVTCYLSGPLEVNHGYRPPEEFGPGVAQALAAAYGTRSCDSANNTCLMIADNLTWERTGDQTVAITIEGVTYAVQFNVLAGTVETRQADFTDLGWVFVLEGSTTLETPLRSWQIIQLSANGFPYGYLAVSDNDSSENPFVFAVSILGSDPLSEAALEALAGVINDLAADFRSAFELLE